MRPLCCAGDVAWRGVEQPLDVSGRNVCTSMLARRWVREVVSTHANKLNKNQKGSGALRWDETLKYWNSGPFLSLVLRRRGGILPLSGGGGGSGSGIVRSFRFLRLLGSVSSDLF